MEKDTSEPRERHLFEWSEFLVWAGILAAGIAAVWVIRSSNRIEDPADQYGPARCETVDAGEEGTSAIANPVSNHWAFAQFGGALPSGKHAGVDFVAEDGECVRAGVSGTVGIVESMMGGMLVAITPNDVSRFRMVAYHRLADLVVVNGQTVVTGQRLGRVEKLNNRDERVLHMQVVGNDGQLINPCVFISCK